MDDLIGALAPYTLIFFVSGFAAYTCTLVIKALWQLKLRKHPNSTEPELWAIMLRVVSTLVGTLSGLGIAMLGSWEVVYGTGLGFIGGAMNAFVVFIFKKWLKKRAGVESSGNTQPPGD